MPVLLFAEASEGVFKKPIFEAATFAYDLAQKLGTDLQAVTVGPVDAAAATGLGAYGVSKVHQVLGDSFVNAAFASAVAKVAESIDAKAVVMAQTYNGRAIAPRVAVKLSAAALSGLITVPDPAAGFDTTRMAYSGKGVEELKVNADQMVITVKTNGYKVEEHPVATTLVEVSNFSSNDVDAVALELIKAAEGISLTEAETVVSAGRGMKGPENWAMIEELASLLGAATACSKPVSDMDWRPHHEHVGQTGIQISPTLYIAIGISGAIQHLAGVSSSKNIVVINKDPEAPFFKIADFGIVGDLFDVVPQLIASLKSRVG
ncbi:MAG: electron transfer flavoprotein subunit alpha/FixB family protein [Bacteroidia bacterium]|nr:electron transfer flavoprotein subunit alpha/FixB family protein [Bacteroidia bacterium]